MKQRLIMKFIKDHWDELIIVLITILSIIIIFIPFMLNNSLDKFDHPGLLSLSWFIKEYTLPNFQGWNPYFFAGFPQGILYPPLFHYLVAILSNIFNLNIAYKLIITTAGVFIPYTIYEFSLKIYKGKTWAVLNTIFILITLLILPGYLGFNYDGFLDYGLGPNFVTIPLFFTYLSLLFSKKINFKYLAVVFSIMLLTNLVAPLVIVLVTIIYFLLNRENKLIRNNIIKHSILSFLLTLFWIIPFLYFYSYSASGYPIKSNKIISIFPFILSIVLIISLLMIKTKSSKKKFLAILLPGIIISSLSIIDSFLNSQNTKFSLPPIHPYRLLIFSYIGVATSIVFLIQNLHPIFLKFIKKFNLEKFFQPTFHASMMISLFLFLSTALMYIRLNPEGVEEIVLKKNYTWDGRVIRAYKVSDVLDQSRAVIDKSVINNPNYFAVDGLLKESSYLAPYYQSLSKSMHPEDFNWENLDNYYLENIQLSEDKTKFLADLLWVKSAFIIGNYYNNYQNCTLLSEFSTNTKNEGEVIRNMYICDYKPSQYSNFSEMLVSKPEVKSGSWDKLIQDWWENEEISIFTNEDIPDLHKSDISYIPEVDFSENFQSIRIKSNVEEKLYYLVKMSYFPKWNAYDMYNNKLKVYKASPNLMIVPIENETILRYENTKVETVTLFISLVVWFSLIFFPIAYRVKRLITSHKKH